MHSERTVTCAACTHVRGSVSAEGSGPIDENLVGIVLSVGLYETSYNIVSRNVISFSFPPFLRTRVSANKREETAWNGTMTKLTVSARHRWQIFFLSYITCNGFYGGIKSVSHVCVGCIHGNQNDSNDRDTERNVAHYPLSNLLSALIATRGNTCPDDFVLDVAFVALNTTNAYVRTNLKVLQCRVSGLAEKLHHVKKPLYF